MAAFRAVLDTNVVLAAHRTENPRSPNLEVLDRWGRREFVLLYSDDVLVEYAEKLAEHGIGDGDVRAFLARVRVCGCSVSGSGSSSIICAAIRRMRMTSHSCSAR